MRRDYQRTLIAAVMRKTCIDFFILVIPPFRFVSFEPLALRVHPESCPLLSAGHT